jgi:general secretion pathway protein D
MKYLAMISLFVVSLATPMLALGDSADQTVARQVAAIPMQRLLELVARKSGKKFILDPRVHADIEMFGEDPTKVTYPELLTILEVYGYSAVEQGGFALVVPAESLRAMPLPQLKTKDSYPDSQYVTAIIAIANLPAATLVPILRPLVPSYGHLNAIVCDNSLILMDTYANVRRFQQLIKSIDVGTPYTPAKCEPPVLNAVQATTK